MNFSRKNCFSEDDFRNGVLEITSRIKRSSSTDSLVDIVDELMKTKERYINDLDNLEVINDISKGFSEEYKDSVIIEKFEIDNQVFDCDGDSVDETDIIFKTLDYHLSFNYFMYSSSRSNGGNFSLKIWNNIGTIELSRFEIFNLELDKNSMLKALKHLELDQYTDNIYNVISKNIETDSSYLDQKWDIQLKEEQKEPENELNDENDGIKITRAISNTILTLNNLNDTNQEEFNILLNYETPHGSYSTNNEFILE